MPDSSLRISDSTEPWMRFGLCVGRPAEFETENVPDAHRAKQLCRGCPVIRDCAGWAVRNQITDMVCAGIRLHEYGDGWTTRNYRKLQEIADGKP